MGDAVPGQPVALFSKLVWLALAGDPRPLGDCGMLAKPCGLSESDGDMGRLAEYGVDMPVLRE